MATRVLVVDDEPAVRHVAAKWLERAGYACREAGSAAEAVQVLQLDAADVAIVDLNDKKIAAVASIAAKANMIGRRAICARIRSTF